MHRALLALPLCATLLSAQAPGSRGPAATPIRTAPIEARTLEQTVAFSGSLASPEDATVGAEVEGRVVAIAADLGDAVGRGRVLARINPDEYRFRLEQAEAARKEAEANLTRAQELSKEGIVSPKDLDNARVAAARANADADLARKRFADTDVKAPFAGAVAQRLVSVGEYVKVGQSLFQVVMTNPLKLTGEVPERHLGQIRPGAAVRLRLDAFPGQTFSGTLTRVAPAIQVQSRAFRVEARIPNPKGLLKPGAFAGAIVVVGRDTGALVVPEAAVTVFAGVAKIFVIEGGVARERRVTVERRLPDGRVALKGEGLRAGLSVAVAGLARLGDGVAVAVQP